MIWWIVFPVALAVQRHLLSSGAARYYLSPSVTRCLVSSPPRRADTHEHTRTVNLELHLTA